MRKARQKWSAGIALVALITVLPTVSSSATVADDDSVFISEIHYDNTGTDTGEAVEIFGPAGTDLSGWTLVLYNGNGGASYNTITLSGVLADQVSGFGVTVVTPSAGLQNGSPDGLALVDDTGSVRQFLSYEGTFTASGGPADGLSSTDIGVSEPFDTAVGHSLQLSGTGSCYEDLTWNGPAPNTFGAVNPIEPDPAADCLANGGGGGEPPAVRISEIHYDNAGADTNEAVEIFGPAGTDLTGWSVVRYNGANGLAYGTDSLSGTIPDLDGTSGVVVISYASNGLQNGAPDGIALVDAAGAVVEFLSYEGVFVAGDGPAAGATSTDIGVSEDGGTGADQSLQRNAAGAWGGPFCASFGEINSESPDVICPTPVQEVFIHQIQGTGDVSPLDGQRVIVEGVVVGDHEGPAPALRGFFVQEEDTDVDSDAATSEGIFVFNFDNDDVSLGDVVRVEGTVQEFRGGTQLTDFVVVEVLDVDPRVATPATVDFPVATVTGLEAVEGMAVTLPQTLVISEYFNFDRFGDVVVALPAPGEDRPINPTALFDEDSTAAAERRDLNLRSRITIDDGISFSNPDNPIHPVNRQLYSLTNSFRGGDQVTGLTGPVFEAFGDYRILPYEDEGFDSYVQTTAPPAPDPVGGTLKVGTLNALNYFLTIDDSGPICGPLLDQGCRGADDANELSRQRTKLLNALQGMDADVVGLVEMENTAGVEALADLAAGLNDRLGAGTYDYVAAGQNAVVGDDAIKVGLIYKPGSVTPVGDVAVLDTADFLDPNNTGESRNRAAVAASFVENATGEVFSVTVNHLKSKGSPCGPGDDHPLAGSCHVTRTLAAQVLADWLATSPTGVADDDWLIIGDLNSYDKEAPIDVLVGEGYTDLIAQYQGELAYSFVFDGEFGYLDYVMSSASLTGQVTGATEWHINADEPDVLDYDTTFKSDYQDTLFDPTTPFRSSDHDAALVGLALDGLDPTVTPDPALLFPPNHRMRTVEISASDPVVGALDVLIVGATSSEPDSGVNNGDQPNDIDIAGADVIQLRAERFGPDGRTYTIDVQLSGGGQVVFDSTAVVVPHDLGNGPPGS